MRKLKLQVQISIDGFIAGPNGEMDWMTWNWDEALKSYVGALTEPIDTILLGRVLAQGFIDHWAGLATNPDTSDAVSRKFHETPKVVFTHTLHEHSWAYTTLAHGDLVEEVTALKQQPGGDIMVYGGSNFVTNLIKHGLIDQFFLFVNPTAIGHGKPIFQGLEQKQALKLVEAKAFECGITVLSYER